MPATVIYGSDELTWRTEIKRDTAFIGGTSNGHGDKDGTDAAHTLFTVTGDVLIRYVFGICNTSLEGAGKLEVGTANNTAKLLAQIQNTTTLDDGDVYTDAGTETDIDLIPFKMFAINDGADIIETTSVADITAGQVDYYCLWAAAESGASVVAA